MDAYADVADRAPFHGGSFRNRVGTTLILLTVFLLAASSVSAETVGDKALRGLSNMLAGVMVFPGEIHKTWIEEGSSLGLTIGIAQGAGMIVVRELIGPFELLTCPVPWPSKTYAPLLLPAYPWGYFQQGSRASKEVVHKRK
jgi:putative exosortase-associated protein (TIGR04073 family)